MKNFILALLITLSTTGIARAQSLTDSLIHCDSLFFSELYHQRNRLKKTASVVTDSAQHAWFISPKNGNGIVWFTEPLKIDRLSALGYFLQENDLGEMGKYYYWGLIFDNSPEAVIATLPEANWHKEGDEFSTNAMIKRPDDNEWKVNVGAAGGIAPAKGSIEKVALLSVSKGKTKLLCTVQGSVNKEILGSLRPDLREEKK